MAESFTPGSLVQLIGGGPTMTVEGSDRQTGGVICSWFNGSKRELQIFQSAALQVPEGPALGFAIG